MRSSPFPFAVWPNALRKSEAAPKPPKNFKAETQPDPSFRLSEVAPSSMNGQSSVRDAVNAGHGIHPGKYTDASGRSWFAKPGTVGSWNGDPVPLGPAAMDEHMADRLYNEVFTGRDGKPLNNMTSHLYNGRTHERVDDMSTLRDGDMPYRVTPFLHGSTSPNLSRGGAPEHIQRKFSEGAVVDALLGSLDMHGENWMYDADGNVNRIDNGCAFGRRASGSMLADHDTNGHYFDPEIEKYTVLPQLAAVRNHAGAYGTDESSLPQSGEEYIEHAQRAIADFDRNIGVAKKIFAGHPEHFASLARRINVLRKMVQHYTTRSTPDALYRRITERISTPRGRPPIGAISD